jgi:2,3-dihydroxybenzoate decarboxylase
MQDFTSVRLEEMAAAGIDMQVVSHSPCPAQNLPAAEAIRLTRLANDRLAAAVRADPSHFAALAMLPTPDPAAAADELARAVRDLGFRGGIVLGLTGGRFLDGPEARPIFATAEALDVPIYLHPGTVHPAVAEAYFAGYRELNGTGMGFTFETATHAARLILSGLFDEHPRLQVILGHLGEALPYLLWRIDAATGASGLKRRFSDYLRRNFHITISGNYSPAALACCLAEMGEDRVLFAVDWPYSSNRDAAAFIENASIPDQTRGRILGGNARRLLRLPHPETP